MARPVTKSFDDRNFGGRRLRAALVSLDITTEDFLEIYSTVQVERSKPTERIAALEARILELTGGAAETAVA